MNKPLYLIRVEGDQISCLGIQLEQILESMRGLVNDCIWYGADVEVNEGEQFVQELSSEYPLRIGSTQDIINLVAMVDQFISGVFVAFSEDLGPKLDMELFTEDDPFRVISQAIIEIRAFDTSYFEIYSDSSEIIGAVTTLFPSEIIVQPTPKRI